MKRLLIFLVALILISSSSISNAHMMGGDEVGERGWLGVSIQNITPELVESLGLKDLDGVLVSDVAEGGPAQAAGIKREDVIKGINGREVKTVYDLLSIIGETSPGDTVTIDISRRGEKTSLKVRLGSLKEVMGEGMVSPEMGGGGMEEIVPSPQAMGEMIGEMIGEMVQGMVDRIEGIIQGMRGIRDAGCPQIPIAGRYRMDSISLLSSELIERLGLTVEQIEKAKELERDSNKRLIRLRSEINTAWIDLSTLLGKDDIDMNEVKGMVKGIEGKMIELYLTMIQSLKDFKGLLTDKQKGELKAMGCF